MEWRPTNWILPPQMNERIHWEKWNLADVLFWPLSLYVLNFRCHQPLYVCCMLVICTDLHVTLYLSEMTIEYTYMLMWNDIPSTVWLTQRISGKKRSLKQEAIVAFTHNQQQWIISCHCTGNIMKRLTPCS